MRKVLTATCATVLLLAGMQCHLMAQGDPTGGQSLSDGQTIYFTGSPPVVTVQSGYTQLDSITRTFTGNNVSGSLTSSVFDNDGNNPYGLNDLTFKYYITITAGTVNNKGMATFANWVTASGHLWDFFLTSVGENNTFDGGNGGDLASSVSEAAGVITWDWSPNLTPSIDGGLSANLFIETDATSYTTQDFSIAATGADPDVTGLIPEEVPEPSIFAFLGLGILGLLAYQQRRLKAKV